MRTFALIACFAITACDSGSSVATIDWKSFESRLSDLESENAELKQQVSECAKLSDIPEIPEFPDLSLYALKTDLAPYALKSEIPEIPEPPDLSAYALKSEIPEVPEPPDLSAYALKSEIPTVPAPPDLSIYALKSEIPIVPAPPDLSGYALKSEIPTMPDLSAYALKDDIPEIPAPPDLTPYATEADIAALDDRLDPLEGEAVRVIRENRTVVIPDDFATFDDAMKWADGYSIAQGFSLTIQFAPSATPYVFTKPLMTTTHRDGGRINIIGDVTDASKVVLSFPQSSAINIRYGRVGLIDGLTFRGGYDYLNPATTPAPANVSDPSGIICQQTAAIFLGKKVIVERFWRSGIRALGASAINAEGVISRQNGEDGFAAVNSGFVYVQDALAQNNARDGFLAAVNGAIEGNRSTASDNGRVGFNAFMGSAIMSNFGTSGVGGFATATNNGWHGFSATGSSGISVPYAVATGNGKNLAFGTGSGFIASNGGGIDANHGQSKSNSGVGFLSFQGGALNAQFAVAELNKQHGFSAHSASSLDALAATSLTNDFAGYISTMNSSVLANRFGGTPAQQGIARQNKQYGFAAFTGGAIDATQGLADQNTLAGVISNGNAIINAPGITVSKNGGDALTTWMGGAIIANSAFNGPTQVPTTIVEPGGSVVNATVGSVIALDNALVTLKADHTSNGINAYNGASVSATNVIIVGAANNAFTAGLGASLDAFNSDASTCGGTGFAAYNGAAIEAGNTTAIDCRGGYDSWNGSAIQANYARCEGSTNNQPGFFAHGNSTITGSLMTSIDGSGAGFDVSIGSAMWAPAIVSEGNLGNGVQVNSTATLVSQPWDDNGTTYYPSVSDNSGGIAVWGGSFAQLSNVDVIGTTQWDALNVNGHSALDISNGTVTGSLLGSAAGIYDGSLLEAYQTTLSGNYRGVSCGVGSVCNLSNATLRNNLQWGVNTYFNAFTMVEGSYIDGSPAAYQPNASTNDQFSGGNFGTPRLTP